MTKERGHVAVVILFIVGMFMSGCGQQPAPLAYTDRQRLMLDTTDNHTKNTDSLLAFVERFRRVGDRHREMAYLAELGHCYQSASRYTDAIKTHRKQLALAQQLNDTLMMATALNDLGVNYRRMGLYYDGLDHHAQAVELSGGGRGEQRDKFLKCQAIGYNGIGNVHLTIGHYLSADSMLRKALAIETRLGSHLGMNVDNSNLGMVFERRGLIDSAWHYFRKAHIHSQQANSSTGLAYSHMNFGRLYQRAGQYDRAVAEFSLAMRVVSRERDLWLWLQPCIAMAGVLVKMQNHAEANRYLSTALTTARQVGAREYYPQIYRLYSDYYRNLGDYRRALETYERASTSADSLMSANHLFEIDELQSDINQRKANERMAQAHHQLSVERTAKRLFAVGLLGAIAVALMLWYVARMRKQSNRMQRNFMQTRNRFFTNITHEFRTPLTVILGKAEELQKATAASLEQQHTAGSMIVRQGRQLLSLVNQLLDISKVKSEVGNPDWHTGNVVPYLHMIVEGGQQLAKTKGITMLFMPKETEIVMDVVPDYLRKIMRNLIGNATKFTPQNGNITVSCERRDNRLCIQVVDDGIGISEESLKHLFEPFYQAESESANLGTGVGLSLVRQLVKAMQGEVSVQSRLGEGATFSILLPLKHGKGNWKPFNEETITEISFDKEPGAGTGQPTGCNSLPDHDHDPRTRVLIVEDNVDVARYIGSQMPSAYSLTYATNGTDGLQKALCLQPDLVITDLMMPGMDGLEMCRRIRADRTIGTTPVIVITAKTTQDDLEAGLRAGASAYLFKPFSASELRIRVEWILAERRMLHDKYQLAAQQVNDAKTVLSQEDKDFVSHFTNTIYNQLHSTEIDLDALADHLCMSRRTLQRKVNDLAGMSLTAYITKIRTDYARQLIRRRPEMPVSEVAQACGFSDRSYFDRMFKQSFGVTPAQYRRNLE